MEIIDAVWEKRNLGVDTTEVEIDGNDQYADVMLQLENLKGQYIVLKIDSGCSEISEKVQSIGYHYIEDIITLEHDLHETQRSPLHQRLYDVSSYMKMDDDDYAELLREVENSLFVNDRISKDSFFEKDQANIRYVNWIKDLREKEAGFYKITYKSEATGFVILQTKNGKEYVSILGGAYEKFRKKGTGIIQKEQEIVKSLGGKCVVSRVSSNNVNQLRALVVNGYVPKQVDHIFVKHIGQRR